MRQSLLLFFASLLFQVTTAIETASIHPVLEPISDDGWFDINLRKRSVKDSLKLLDSEHLLWSSPQNSSGNVFVNMTMFTADDELIISMERFANVLKMVNCNESMSMTFISNSSYQQAINSWDWVNFNENRTFIIIANAHGCGAARSRQPWVVNWAEYDPRQLTVHLNATKKDWKEVAHSYNMDFGQYGPAMPSNNEKRMSWDNSVSLDLTAEAPAQFYASLPLPDGISFSFTCTQCGTRGTLLMSGHIETSWFSMKSFTVQAVPQGIGADLNMKFTLAMTVPDTTFSPDPITFFTIPLDGFSIPGLLELGPALTLGAGLSIGGIQGSASIGASISATIPDTAVAEYQLAEPRGATFSGWTPQFSNGPLNISEALTASVEVYGRAEVGVSLELLGTGIDFGLVLKIPDVVLSASQIYDSSGVCADKKYEEGVSLGLSVGADLSLIGSTDLVGSTKNFLNMSIFKIGDAYRPQGPCLGFGQLVGQ